MDDWFSVIDARCELPASAVQDLRDVGFVVIPGPVAPDRMAQFAEASASRGVPSKAPISAVMPSRRSTRLRAYVRRLSVALDNWRNTCWRSNSEPFRHDPAVQSPLRDRDRAGRPGRRQ